MDFKNYLVDQYLAAYLRFSAKKVSSGIVEYSYTTASGIATADVFDVTSANRIFYGEVRVSFIRKIAWVTANDNDWTIRQYEINGTTVQQLQVAPMALEMPGVVIPNVITPRLSMLLGGTAYWGYRVTCRGIMIPITNV